jgi:hypothetical protein
LERIDVYKALDSERDYQDAMTASDDRPDMIKDLGIGATLLAMKENLHRARVAWYSGAGNHLEAMAFVRKTCGLGVQLGESLGMPRREGF